MKKLLYILQIIAFSMLYSASAMAWDHHGGGWGHHGWGHHHGHHGWGRHHGHHGWRRPQVNNYYYPAPQPNYYYQQPPVAYAPPPPPPPVYGGYYDNRSHQGLAGGVLGTVFGYELGNGHPLAAGVGAAAGSFLGNGMGWRY
jgi:hypothetical protein